MSGKVTTRMINGRLMAVVGATKNEDGEYVGGTIIGPAKEYEKEGMSLADQIGFGKKTGGYTSKAVMKKRGGTFKGVF